MASDFDALMRCPIFRAFARMASRMAHDPQYLRGKYVHKNKNKHLRRHPMRSRY